MHTPSPDAELLDLAGQFMTIQARCDALNASAEDDQDDELNDLIAAQAPLLDDMADLPATTLAGQRARARVLMSWYDVQDKGGSVIEWDRLRPLFRDLLGEAF